jgi:hypothetical protein
MKQKNNNKIFIYFLFFENRSKMLYAFFLEVFRFDSFLSICSYSFTSLTNSWNFWFQLKKKKSFFIINSSNNNIIHLTKQKQKKEKKSITLSAAFLTAFFLASTLPVLLLPFIFKRG